MPSKDITDSTPSAPNRSRFRVCFHDAATNLTKSVTLSHLADAKALFLRLGAVPTIDFAELTRIEGGRVVEVLADHFSDGTPEGSER